MNLRALTAALAACMVLTLVGCASHHSASSSSHYQLKEPLSGLGRMGLAEGRADFSAMKKKRVALVLSRNTREMFAAFNRLHEKASGKEKKLRDTKLLASKVTRVLKKHFSHLTMAHNLPQATRKADYAVVLDFDGIVGQERFSLYFMKLSPHKLPALMGSISGQHKTCKHPHNAAVCGAEEQRQALKNLDAALAEALGEAPHKEHKGK